MTTIISTADARKHLAELVNRVAYGSESVVLTRRGEKVAALISMEELELLQKVEELVDLEDARKALEEPGENLPAAEFWKALGL